VKTPTEPTHVIGICGAAVAGSEAARLGPERKLEIWEHLQHNRMVEERLALLYRTGQVVGRIRYAELEIERGGQISGDVQVITDAAVPRLTDEIKRSRFGNDSADTGLHLERENDIRA